MKTKKLLPILLLSMLSFSLNAQLSFKIGVGPQLSKYSVPFVEFDGYLGMNADFRMVLRSEKKLQLEIGLGYNQKGNISKLHELRWPSQHDGNGGFDPTLPTLEPNDLASLKFKRTISFIELPIQGSFFFKKAKEVFYALGSLRPSLAFAYTNTIRQFDSNGDEIKKEKSSVDESLQPKDFNVISRAGFGFEKATKTSTNYFIEIYAETQLIDLATTKYFDEKFFYYGFGTLLGIRF